MLCYYCVIIDKTTTQYLGLFYGINPQPYLISAFSIKLIAKPTLFWTFLQNKFKLQNFGKKPSQVHLTIIREWTKENCPYLKNLDNFLPATFYLTPPVQLGTKEYLILAFSLKNISNRPLVWSFQSNKYPAKSSFNIFSRMNPKLYLLSAFWTI